MRNVLKSVLVILLLVGGIWHFVQSFLAAPEIKEESSIVAMTYFLGVIGPLIIMVITAVYVAVGGFEDNEGNEDNNKKDINTYKF